MNMIKIDFTKTDGTYTLQDALYLPEDHQLSEADIEAIKQDRFDKWVAVITAPSVDVPVIDATVAGV